MVKITELNTTILDNIKNGDNINSSVMKLYDKGLKYNYELCKRSLDIQKREIDNRYKVANSVVTCINYLDNRRDNYIRLLSLLLLLTGGTISYVCYKNTDSIHKGLSEVYMSLDNNIMSNSSYYEQFSLDEGIYIIGYLYTFINSFIRVISLIIGIIKFIVLSLLGILLGLTEMGSVIISSIIFFITVVFTMCMIKLMSSSISIGITGTHIRDERININIGDLGKVLDVYLNGKTST